MIQKNNLPCAVVIIPTFNEADTIGHFLDHVFLNIFPSIALWRMNVLVVDGHSSDGTAEIVKDRQKNSLKIFGGLHLLSEEGKEGIGAAYMKGFRYAMEKLSADVIIECDADFQHPPESIPALIHEIDNSFDYVVGSRNIRGGADERQNRSLKSEQSRNTISRVFLTTFGGWCARLILFFPSRNFFTVTDPTSGFKATRVKGFADRLDLDPSHLYSRKFGYKVQLLAETLNLKARYKEIPLRFRERTAGSSKFETWSMAPGIAMTGGTTGEILSACFRTRFHDPSTRKFFKFAVVGGIGYVVNAVVLQLISMSAIFVYFSIVHNAENTVAEAIAWTLSAEAAIISNFILNNVWTFKDEHIVGIRRSIMKFFQFNLTSLGAIVIQAVLGTIAVLHFGSAYRQLILFIVIVCAVVPYNWFMYTRVVWKKEGKKQGKEK